MTFSGHGWLFSLSLACSVPVTTVAALELDGAAIQGGLIFGTAEPGDRIFLEDKEVMVSASGEFVIGFGRDESGQRNLRISEADGSEQNLNLEIAARDYQIERVEGLPPKTVTPDPEAAERIAQEGALVSSARKRRDQRTDCQAIRLRQFEVHRRHDAARQRRRSGCGRARGHRARRG